MNFTVFETATGTIKWSGTCAPDDYPNQHVPADCSIIPVAADAARQFVAGIYIEDIPERPSEWHDWDAESRQWVQRPQDELLGALKERKREEINEARLAANQASFTFRGKEVAADPLSRGDIDGVSSYVAMFNEFPQDFPMAWKCLDNSWVPLSGVADWKEFITAMVMQGQSNFAKSQALKTQLDSATTPTEVEAIKW